MLEVIGAGLGRTGTHSLSRALEILGIAPCYHMYEFRKHPEHLGFWQDALVGKPVDWQAFFRSYKATVEWPAVSFLPQLIAGFSGAKVILTYRDPDRWFSSANETIFEALELSEFNPNPSNPPQSAFLRRLILQRTFSGRQRDKQQTIQVYRKHVENVRRLVPSERLLQFDVVDGWLPLCAFLKREEPDVAFPWLNERSEFMASEPEWAKAAKKMLAEREQRK
jgi:hypothetical protein